MFTLILAALAPVAHAQSEAFADTAAGDAAPQGCWGTVQYAAPQMGAQDVPVNIAPRFFMEGMCDTNVVVELRDANATVVEAQLEFTLTQWGTTFVVQPAADLAPNSEYSLFISPDLGSETLLTFTTGDTTADGSTEVTVSRFQIDGFCSGRGEAEYSATLELSSESRGFIGFVTGQVGLTSSYAPILNETGSLNTWAIVDAEIGDETGCVYIATYSDDGQLSDWQETCTEVPDVGTCRNGLFNGGGCRGQAEPTPLRALLLLPFLPLFLRRRRTA